MTPEFVQDNQGIKTIGIKRSTATLGEKGIWAASLLKSLGFYPVVSPKSDADIAKTGVDNSRTEFCIASKLATGHTISFSGTLESTPHGIAFPTAVA